MGSILPKSFMLHTDKYIICNEIRKINAAIKFSGGDKSKIISEIRNNKILPQKTKHMLIKIAIDKAIEE